MPPPIRFSLHLKNRNEVASALRRASIVTGKLPSQLANRFVYSMAIRARNALPAVASSKIRTELEETKAMELVRTKDGKRFSRSKKHIKSFFGSGKAVPFLALIIQSRVKKDGFWKVGSSPFKGVSREEGGRRMLEKMRKVSSARVRSVGFFKVCAATVMFLFKRSIGQHRAPQAGGAGSISSRIGKLAGGVPSAATGKASSTFWISATRPDTEEGKQALSAVAQPVWQRAMDDEASSLRNYTAKKEYQQAMAAAGLKVI